MAEFQTTASIPREFMRVFSFNRSQIEKEFFLNFLEKSDAYMGHFSPTWDDLLDNYMVIPQRPTFERIRRTRDLVRYPMKMRDRSRLKDPETHQAVETLVAQAMGLLMGTRDYLTVSPRGSNDYEKSRMLSQLLMAILEMPGWFRTQYQAIKNAFIFGTAILELTWLTRTRWQMMKGPIFDEMGNFIGQGVKPEEVIYFDGPLLKEIDIYDFRPDPGGTRIHENMDFVAKRFRTTKHKALELVEAGVYMKEPTLRAIALAEQAKKFRKDGMHDKFPHIPNDVPDEYGMMTGFEGIGEVPYTPEDGYRNRVLTMLNGEIVRSHINPMIDGNKWFLDLTVNPMSGRFYGLAPTEAVRYLQDATDALLMIYTDVAGLAAHGPLLTTPGAAGDINRLRKRIPLDVIEMPDPDKVKAYPIDIGALQFAAQEMARRKMSIREATGANNQLQAIGTGDQTATEVSEMVRLATQRVDLMVQLIERDTYPRLGSMILSRLKQFAPPEGVAAFFRGEMIEATLDDVDEADVYFSGSRHAMSQFQRAATMREAINVLSVNRDFITQYPDVGLIYLRDVLHLPNAEQVVQKAVQEAQTQNMLEMAMQNEAAGMGTPTGSSEEAFGTEAGETEREGQRVA